MNKFRAKRGTGRTRPEWLLKLQRHLATVVTEPGHLHRLDFAHQADCAKWNGGPCNCSPHVTVDGHIVNG